MGPSQLVFVIQSIVSQDSQDGTEVLLVTTEMMGKLFCEAGQGKDWKGTPYRVGDTIGCGIDFEAGISSCCSVYFTKNGQLIDTISDIRIPNGGLYPMVGMHSEGEKARLNLLPEVRGVAR